MSGPVLIQGAMEVAPDWLGARLERPAAWAWGGCRWALRSFIPGW